MFDGVRAFLLARLSNESVQRFDRSALQDVNQYILKLY
jgi:hypothetical protein